MNENVIFFGNVYIYNLIAYIDGVKCHSYYVRMYNTYNNIHLHNTFAVYIYFIYYEKSKPLITDVYP